MAIKLTDQEDYELVDGAAWFSTNGFSIRIKSINDPDQSIAYVTIFKEGCEMEAPLASVEATLEQFKTLMTQHWSKQNETYYCGR